MRQVIFLAIVATLCNFTSSFSVLNFETTSTHLDEDTESDWGEWGAWQPCSRSCGGGVTYMLRHCKKTRPDGQPDCFGPERKYSSCDIQDCPDGSVDFRSEQCSNFNNQTFRGRTHVWKPYLGGSPNPCELHCQPQDESFSIKQTDKVIDGTRCHQNAYDVCVDGTCQEVGCDMMLGSDLKEDNCKECGGDGSSCYLVQDIYNNPHPPKGYNGMIVIPVGATNIEIDEYKASRNYLVVRNATGDYVLNGNWNINSSQTIQVAGTSLQYQRKMDRRKAPERITASGPTTEEIYIDLLVQQRRNKGIKYSFYLPVGMDNPNRGDLAWVTSEWSECSRNCGKGTQNRRVSCRKNGKKVTSSLCKAIPRPQRRQQCNLQPCLARWHHSNWTDCTTSCNGGLRFRQVYCTDVPENINSALWLVPDRRCLDEDNPVRPFGQESCNEHTCPEWIIGSWSECSATCNLGSQTRVVRCEPASACDTTLAPENARGCNNGPCTGVEWVVTEWSSCTERCGEGMQTRLVHCASVMGKIYNDSLCSSVTKPAANQSCHSSSGCSNLPYWMSGEWSECSAQCGVGMQTRQVVCAARRDTTYVIFSDERCAENEEKPSQVQDCTRPSCVSAWFTGPWSECSSSCNGGRRERRVSCLSELTYMILEEKDCHPVPKPDVLETCNIEPCRPSVEVECQLSSYGCCPDNKTPAQGPSMQGCPAINSLRNAEQIHCSLSLHGCCRDGARAAAGPNNLGCPEYELCYVASASGTYCDKWQPRWYFDAATSKCRHFWYGGCEGNDNNYKTEERCIEACESSFTEYNEEFIIESELSETTTRSKVNSPVTHYSLPTTMTAPRTKSTTALPVTTISTVRASTAVRLRVAASPLAPIYIPPTRSQDDFYLNKVFVAPLRGNERQELQLATETTPVTSGYGSSEDKSRPVLCSLPASRGSCYREYVRWHYDPIDQVCKRFSYSGCSGNENNFKTPEKCERTCQRKPKNRVNHDPLKEETRCETEEIIASFEDSRIPSCDPSTGLYRPLQCISDVAGATDLCWCVDPESGREIEGTRRYSAVPPDCNSDKMQATNPISPCSRSSYGCCADGVTPYDGHGSCAVPVRLTPVRTLINVRKGDSARLSCHAEGFPKPTVRWFRNGVEIREENSRQSVAIDREHPGLLFSLVDERVIGSYVCQASNGVSDPQTQTFELALLDENVRFRTRPADVTVHPGQTAKLKCSIRDQQGTITWYKDGLLVRQGHLVTIKPWGDLRIRKTKVSDEGRYTCVATNSEGRALSASAMITVSDTTAASRAFETPSNASSTLAATEVIEQCVDFPQFVNCRLILQYGMCANYTKYCCATCRNNNSPLRSNQRQRSRSTANFSR